MTFTPNQYERLEVELMLIQLRIEAINATIKSLVDPFDLAIERGILLFQETRLKVFLASRYRITQPPSSSTSTGVTG